MSFPSSCQKKIFIVQIRKKKKKQNKERTHLHKRMGEDMDGGVMDGDLTTINREAILFTLSVGGHKEG